MHVIAEGLFTDEASPRLIGGRNRNSGRIVFPCPPGAEFEPWPLAREGRLWSFTVQRYRPKSPPYAGPEAFRPWIVGYVELPGEVIVESRVVNIGFDEVQIGMELELTFVPLDPDAAEPVMIHAFQPKGASA
ncbi:Zn-ribbon domain-containing OB-fold protein [Rhizorhabdus sp. FW153]|uniref:Zn-ribbon domain-containing OB-fold protein n=1 Tax=Rhizorhabdus sp. FW153 TaxID=3400216 RepID=UPI003CF0BD62